MDITYKANEQIVWSELEDGSLFLTEYGRLCVKLPELTDEHGLANCYCFSDNKYYFYKDWQKVGVVRGMEIKI